jgi:hypothetical protein
LLGLWRAGAWPAAVFRERTLKRRGVGVFSCLPRSRCARIPERRHCLHTLTLLQRALDSKRCTARGRMACGRALLTWPAHALRWLATACLSPPPHLAELAHTRHLARTVRSQVRAHPVTATFQSTWTWTSLMSSSNFTAHSRRECENRLFGLGILEEPSAQRPSPSPLVGSGLKNGSLTGNGI